MKPKLKMSFSVFLSLFVFLSFPAQKYSTLLSYQQKKDLTDQVSENKSYSLFSYPIDSKGKTCYFLYDKDALIREYITKKDKRSGIEYSYNTNGTLQLFKEWNQGCYEGIECQFDTLGLIISSGNKIVMCRDSVLVHCDTTYDNYGNLCITMYSTQGFSLKEGRWKYYNKFGECIKIELWKNGELMLYKE